MDRNFVKALLSAWDRPEFRAGLQHLIDLDEMTTLLVALSQDDRDHQVELRALGLLRSAVETDEIRRAVLMLVETDDVRAPLLAGIADSLADRPRLGLATRSALDDPSVRRELHAALETPHIRGLIWTAVEHRGRWALVRAGVALLVRHRHARRLAWALKRHGVIRELRRPPAPV